MLIFSSKKMADVVTLAERAAEYPVNVLILGETGCGKELIARHIHETSKAGGKFVSVNCTAFPQDLLESELFGYVKGAFTGAYSDKKGIMEEAGGGSLLLDEIGDMPIKLQPKLLRALDTKKFMPLGTTTRQIEFNARVIATTNCDLSDSDNFRSDLYFRLGTIIINIPPLRERPDDIISLTSYLLGEIQKEFELKNFPKINNRVYTILLGYTWPGNVRELQNILKRSLILGNGNLKTDVVKKIVRASADFFGVPSNTDSTFVWRFEKDGTNLSKIHNKLDKHIIKHILKIKPKITRVALAKELGVTVPTVMVKLKDFKLFKYKIKQKIKELE